MRKVESTACFANRMPSSLSAKARGVEIGARRPLPADCPICFEEIVEEKAGPGKYF